MPLTAARVRLLRRVLSATWVGLALLPAPLASADDLRGARSGELMAEKRHLIELTLDRGHAELVSRRTVENGSTEADELQISLDLPEGAVATRLRALGGLDAEPQWFSANLFDAERAQSKYLELNGIGAGPARASTLLLSWESPGQLTLVASPILAGKRKIIEYTLKIPLKYENGRDQLTLPKVASGRVQPDYIVRPARKGDAVLVDGIPVKNVAYLKGDAAEEPLSLGLIRAAQPALDGALAMVPFAKERFLVRWRVEAAAKLSHVPRGAHIVILIDSSRSITTVEGSADLAAAQAYLGHFSDAKVSVLTFDRKIQAVTEGFVPAARAAAILGSFTIVRRNGSRIDDALDHADALLAKTPAHAPRRILALTDLLTRSDVDAEHIRVAPRSGALVHAAMVRAGSPSVSRDDDHGWAKAVRATGGLVWRASASTQADERAAMRGAFEEWARPIRIDQLTVRASGIASDTLLNPAMLEEGQSFDEIRIETKEVPLVEIDGEIWARPVRRVLAPDAQEGLLWTAQVFGSELLDKLSPDEMRTLARRGQVVTPVTSLLAVEPEAGPWTGGFEEQILGHSSRSVSVGSGSGFGRGSSRLGSANPKEQEWLQTALSFGWRGCGGGATAAKLTVETTRAEIADLTTPTIRGRSGTSEPARCLTELAWNLDLPPDLFTRQWAKFTIQL